MDYITYDVGKAGAHDVILPLASVGTLGLRDDYPTQISYYLTSKVLLSICGLITLHVPTSSIQEGKDGGIVSD